MLAAIKAQNPTWTIPSVKSKVVYILGKLTVFGNLICFESWFKHHDDHAKQMQLGDIKMGFLRLRKSPSGVLHPSISANFRIKNFKQTNHYKIKMLLYFLWSSDGKLALFNHTSLKRLRWYLFSIGSGHSPQYELFETQTQFVVMTEELGVCWDFIQEDLGHLQWTLQRYTEWEKWRKGPPSLPQCQQRKWMLHPLKATR